MRRSFISFIGILCGLGVGCGGGDGLECPPDYPIERDGACYRADDGGLVGLDGARPMTDGSVASDGGGAGDDGSVADGGIPTDAQVMCEGVHPNVMGMRRFCDPGACYCGDETLEIDVCYAQAIADTCCPVDVVCEPGTDGGAVACMGSHPLVSSTRRYCEPGNCYCGDLTMMPPLDVCYDAAVADACCPIAVVCD